MRKLQHVSVIGMDEVRAMLDLEAQKQMMGCGEEKSCLAEIAGAVGADVLVVGGIVDIGGERVVTLKRIDQKSASVAQQASQRLANEGKNGEEILAAVGPAIEKLFPDFPLRKGETRGVDPQMALLLNPPPLPVWAFATSAAVTGAALVATGVSALVWQSAQSAYRDEGKLATTQTVAGADVVSRESAMLGAETTMWILVGATATTAVVTAAMVPFVDWNGYAERS